MLYKLPSPAIYQILLRASQNLADSELLACFVGPINQVEKETLIPLTFPVSNSTVIYPNLKIGAVIKNDSVKIKTKNTFVEIKSSTAAGSNFVANTDTVTITDAFTEAKASDIITLSSNGGTYTIKTVLSNSSVKLNETIHHSSTSETFTIKRLVGDVECVIGGATYSSNSITFTSLKYNNYTVVAGEAYISYVALRKDLTGFYDVTNPDTLSADMSLDPLNPLGYYLGVIAQAANGGTRVLAYILPDNEDVSYTTALENLGTRKEAYLLVPLSSSSTVLNAFAAHATLMSQPDQSFFRAAILNSKLVEEETLVESVVYTKS